MHGTQLNSWKFILILAKRIPNAFKNSKISHIAAFIIFLAIYIPLMIKKKVTILNSTGLHARPAAALVKLASNFQSDFYIHSYGYRVNGKSILGVMTLAAEHGAQLELEWSGPDETEAMKAITELIDQKFGMGEEH